MDNVADLNKARFDRANSSKDISAADALREALRAIEAGECTANSVIVIAITDDGEHDTFVELFHGGPASTNDRIAMFTRATFMTIDAQ